MARHTRVYSRRSLQQQGAAARRGGAQRWWQHANPSAWNKCSALPSQSKAYIAGAPLQPLAGSQQQRSHGWHRCQGCVQVPTRSSGGWRQQRRAAQPGSRLYRRCAAADGADLRSKYCSGCCSAPITRGQTALRPAVAVAARGRGRRARALVRIASIPDHGLGAPCRVLAGAIRTSRPWQPCQAPSRCPVATSCPWQCTAPAPGLT